MQAHVKDQERYWGAVASLWRVLFEMWEYEFMGFLLLMLSDTTSKAAFSISRNRK